MTWRLLCPLSQHMRCSPVARRLLISAPMADCQRVELRFKEAKTKMVRELVHDETGASMAEYAMLLALIAVATIGAVQALRNQIISVFNTSASTIGSAQ